MRLRHALWVSCVILAAPGIATAGQTIAEVQAGSPVTVSGVVHKITDEDTFVLKDHTGEVAVYIGPNPMSVTTGMPITVQGMVDDGLIREIYAQQITDDKGQVTTFTYDYD